MANKRPATGGEVEEQPTKKARSEPQSLVIFGLGNDGKGRECQRHNAGHCALRAFIQRKKATATLETLPDRPGAVGVLKIEVEVAAEEVPKKPKKDKEAKKKEKKGAKNNGQPVSTEQAAAPEQGKQEKTQKEGQQDQKEAEDEKQQTQQQEQQQQQQQQKEQKEGAVEGGSSSSRRCCYLLPPQSSVNDSGKSLQKALEALGLPKDTPFLALVDDVALPVGTIRLKAKGSSGGHNALKDLEALFTDKYHRLKIGIGGERRVDHVVGTFTAEEAPHFERIFTKAAEAVELWASNGPENVEKVMSTVNQVGFSKVEATGEATLQFGKVLVEGS